MQYDAERSTSLTSHQHLQIALRSEIPQFDLMEEHGQLLT